MSILRRARKNNAWLLSYHVAIRNKAEDPIIRMLIEAFPESLDNPMPEESLFELLK